MFSGVLQLVLLDLILLHELVCDYEILGFVSLCACIMCAVTCHIEVCVLCAMTCHIELCITVGVMCAVTCHIEICIIMCVYCIMSY